MTFRRALPADLVAMACALGLLLVVGVDWYGTNAGDEARRIERLADPDGALGGEVPREVDERARASAEEAEKNALQVTGAVDRVILAGVLATALLALAAGFLRAGGRRFRPPLTPSVLAALFACATALLSGGRLVEQPGIDPATTVKAGAPGAVVLLGLIALSGAVALRREEDGTAWPEPARATQAEESGGVPAGDAGPSIESTR